MERGSANPLQLPASPPRSRCISREARCPASLLAFPGGGGPAQTLNFSGVQNLRRLLLPAAPALPLDARSPAVSVQQGIGSRSLGVSLGERIAAPVPAAGGQTRAPSQRPGHPAPAQPRAGEAAAGAYRAEQKGASSGAGSPWTCVGGVEESRSYKEEEAGGTTVARSRRHRRHRLLGARAGCSTVKYSGDTLALAVLLLGRGFSAHPSSSGRRAWRARSPPSPPLPDSPWSRGLERAAHGSRATEAPPAPAPPRLSTCPFRIPSLGARAAP